MILSNQVRCKKCGDTPFSRHGHDYVECKCGAIAVDGGTEYLRRVGHLDAAEEMSIEVNEAAGRAAIEGIKWAHDNNRNEFGILCAVARSLRDNGVVIFDTATVGDPIAPNSEAEWDLELAVFYAANRNDVPTDVRAVVKRLWVAFVAREQALLPVLAAQRDIREPKKVCIQHPNGQEETAIITGFDSVKNSITFIVLHSTIDGLSGGSRAGSTVTMSAEGLRFQEDVTDD